MELFAKRGYSEIIGIKNIYGEAVDEEEALNSIEDY